MSWIKARVEHNGSRLEDNIRGIIDQERQLINTAAAEAAKALQSEINRNVDRPAPFTQRAVGVSLSQGKRLEAVVYIGAIQSSYLSMIISGGTSTTLKPVPSAARENSYGNLPMGSLKRGRGKMFTIKSRGDMVERVFTRDSGGLSLVATWSQRRGYAVRVKWREAVEKAVKRVIKGKR